MMFQYEDLTQSAILQKFALIFEQNVLLWFLSKKVLQDFSVCQNILLVFLFRENDAWVQVEKIQENYMTSIYSEHWLIEIGYKILTEQQQILWLDLQYGDFYTHFFEFDCYKQAKIHIFYNAETYGRNNLLWCICWQQPLLWH